MIPGCNEHQQKSTYRLVYETTLKENLDQSKLTQNDATVDRKN